MERETQSLSHLSVHQWVRSAIHASTQHTSPIGFVSLKLRPPPCAVLCFIHMYVYTYVYIYILHTKPTLAQPNRSTGGRGGSRVGDPRAGENFLGLPYGRWDASTRELILSCEMSKIEQTLTLGHQMIPHDTTHLAKVRNRNASNHLWPKCRAEFGKGMFRCAEMC